MIQCWLDNLLLWYGESALMIYYETKVRVREIVRPANDVNTLALHWLNGDYF